MTIEIKESGFDKYTLSAPSNVLGRRYDNNAEKIKIVIPDAESDHTCKMIVTRQCQLVDVITVIDGEVQITSNLSQYGFVEIGFSFFGDNGYVKNSEIESFEFLDAQKPVGFMPVKPEMEKEFLNIIKYGFTNSRLDGNDLVFYNVHGIEVLRYNLSPFVQAQSDFAETDESKETFIKNKPTKLSQFQNDMGYVTQDDIENLSGTIENLSGNIDETNRQVQNLEEQVETKANKTIVAEYILSANAWTNNEQTLSILGKTSENNAKITTSNSGTNEEVFDNNIAISEANIYRITDNGTSLTFVCENTPTVDLKIQVEVSD